MAPLPVLLTHFGEDWIRGSETVLLDLLRHIDRDRIAPVVWCNADAMAAACRELRVPTYQSPFEFWFDYDRPRFAPMRYLTLVREGLRLVRSERIRVLHANSAAPAQWLAPVAMATGRPLVAHLHIDYKRRSRYALLLHLADLVVGVSRRVIDDFVADGMPADRLRVIYNGIDPERLHPAGERLRQRLGIPEGVLLIGSIGSLIHRKGHDLLLKALAGGGAALSEAHAVIGGSGPDAARIIGLARELGLGGRVHFAGHMADPGSLYAAVNLFVLASRGEGLPLVLAEAGCCGLPVVATRVGGVPEVVADGETGLLVPPDDVPALTVALGRLAADPVLRRRLGENARARVDRMFTVRRMAAEFEDCYEAIALNRASRLALGRFRPYGRMFRPQRQGV